MIPLFREPQFTFCFETDRLIPRFHLDGIEAGRRVTVFRYAPDTRQRLECLAMAIVEDGGWVDLPEPLIVRAGSGFVVVPDEPG